MALSGKDTGGSQWFATHSPQPHLDGGYTVFGKVVSGMDVVDKIAKAPTGAGGPFPTDVPSERVVITKAYVVDAK